MRYTLSFPLLLIAFTVASLSVTTDGEPRVSFISAASAAEADGHSGGSGGGHDSGAGGHTGGAGEQGGCGGGGCGGAGGQSGGAGGHTGGAGGHAGGGKGKGQAQGQMGAHGAEHPGHGTKPGHVGHTSGVHQPTSDSHESAPGRSPRFRARAGYGYQDTYFGGGSRIGGLEHVPEGIGGFGYSFGLGPAYHSRFRYWGGRAIAPDENDDVALLSLLTIIPPGPGGGGAYERTEVTEGRCDDINPESPDPFGQRNLLRLAAAHEKLAPGFDSTKSREKEAAFFALAIYQHEMLAKQPDLLFAGSYLGSVAKAPVTPDLVQQLNFVLCIAPAGDRDARVAEIAEGQRSKLLARTR